MAGRGFRNTRSGEAWNKPAEKYVRMPKAAKTRHTIPHPNLKADTSLASFPLFMLLTLWRRAIQRLRKLEEDRERERQRETKKKKRSVNHTHTHTKKKKGIAGKKIP